MKHILVVDNDRIFAKQVSKFLAKEGYAVKTADDGLSALDVLKTYTPDVIFIDLVMPNIDGETLCRILRGMEKFENTRLVILSAISAEESLDLSGLGVDACIAKGPFKDLSRHLLTVIEAPEPTADTSLPGNVYGIENVNPRGITSELLSTKRHLRIVLEKMADGLFEISESNRIVYANPAALALAGSPMETILGRTFIDLFSDDERDRARDLLTDADAASAESKRPIHWNGHWVTMSITALYQTGFPKIVLMHDVTDSYQAQNELRMAREYAQNIIDSSLDMIISVDNERRIVEFNRAAEKAFGYRKKEVAGKSIDMLYADNQEGLTLRSRTLENKDYIGEVRNINKAGDTFTSRVSMSFMHAPDGSVIGAVGVSRDITEEKKLQAELEAYHDNLEKVVAERTRALRESETRYRTLFERADDAIFQLQAEEPGIGNIIDANDAAARMHGYTKEELLQLNIADLDAPGQDGEVAEGFERLLNGESIQIELLHRRKDGSTFPVAVNAGMVQLEDQKVILAFDRDISAQKSALEEKEKLTRQLQRAEKMEAIGRLAGGVAHDLNNILSGIVSYPELILLDLPEDSPLHRPVSIIREAGHKAAAIVQDLLTLARRGVVIDEVVDLKTVIEDYLRGVAFMEFFSHFPDVQLEVNLHPDTSSILGSPVHLEKMVMNLVSNAVEAITLSGNVTITLKNIHLEHDLGGYEAVKAGDYVLLQVEDTGQGIPAEHVGKIFEPFYSKKKMGRSGTGLGMAVIWGTVKDHNGFVDIQSRVNEGTRFSLYFPATRREATRKKASAAIDRYKGHQETLLVVDDVPEQREIAGSILSRLGYRVHTVSSGEKAVEYLRDHRVDLLVLDMIMEPGMDGLETYRKIIEREPDQKAVIVSGFSEAGHVQKAQHLGIASFIKKPYTIEKLGFAVKDALSG